MQKACDIAQRQVKRLIRLIGDLLDVSQIQAGHLPLRLSRVDLAEVAREVAEQLYRDIARPREMLQLNALSPVIGYWDRTRLEQIVTNLLSNALKFSAGKPVEISVEEGPNYARLTVRDYGIGIAPDRLPYIFDRFERAVSSQEYSGLGLGLYIVRNIVQELGGSIRVKSKPGHGSTFTVELPRVLPPEADTPPE